MPFMGEDAEAEITGDEELPQGPLGSISFANSNAERYRAFARWLRSYNRRRTHTALDGLTPMAVLINNLDGKHN
jgi:transposase InsO family protein